MATRTRTKQTFSPTPISSKYSKPPSRTKRIAKGTAIAGATAGVAYLGYHNRAAISSSAKINYTVAKKTFSKYQHKAMPIVRQTRYKARMNFKYPFRTGYRIQRTMGGTKSQAFRQGARNVYNKNRGGAFQAANRAAAAFHSYRRTRRDFRGRFMGSF